MLEYTDEFGNKYEIEYIVTRGDEGPEYYRWRRVKPLTRWMELPVWAIPLPEIEAHFHGELKG